ncbi:unnamed protein product [Angiostrongylus costaricensis]|uniref:GST C-terminal domain-containing protein n=1 Tax=Angiostrongylus costaricensis TaxID=334426 RepID=A0A0R3PIL6_ANGCS|nr:unnamed protein product [Angiostrongylus costaricensis]
MYADAFTDLMAIGAEYAHEEDPVLKDAKEAIFTNQILEDHLKKNGGEHFVGNKVLWCDLLAVYVLSLLEELKSDILREFPDLQSYYTSMRNLPQIKDYVENKWPPATVQK